MTYILDTNIFITAKNELPMDVYPSFWLALSQLAAKGDFRSIKKEVYSQAAKTEFVSVADSWIVAEALSQSLTVVTHETSDPLCRKRVKIPDVCNAVGVKYCNLNDAFRALGVTI